MAQRAHVLSEPDLQFWQNEPQTNGADDEGAANDDDANEVLLEMTAPLEPAALFAGCVLLDVAALLLALAAALLVATGALLDVATLLLALAPALLAATEALLDVSSALLGVTPALLDMTAALLPDVDAALPEVTAVLLDCPPEDAAGPLLLNPPLEDEDDDDVWRRTQRPVTSSHDLSSPMTQSVSWLHLGPHPCANTSSGPKKTTSHFIEPPECRFPSP